MLDDKIELPCFLNVFQTLLQILPLSLILSLLIILGIALHLSDDPSSAELVYKKALSLASKQQAHAILSNLGNLYRREKRFKDAKATFAKSLELCPGYAPAYNNLGLVYVAEGLWEDAKSCFEKALKSDPLLDAAQSNMTKASAITSTLKPK